MSDRPKRQIYLGLFAAITLLGGLGIFLLQTDTAESQSQPLQKLWLQAESEIDNTRAMVLWEELVAKTSVSQFVDTGIPAIDVRKMLFHSYLKAKEWQKAEALIPAFTAAKDSIWAHLLLGQAQAAQDKHGAWAQILKAAEQAKSLTPLKQRSYTLHGIIAVALARDEKGEAVFAWDGLELAERLTPLIASAWHRADAMRLMALQQKEPEGKLQQLLHQSLKLPQSEEKKREKQLWNLYQKAKKEDVFLVALDALSGIYADKVQQKELYEWAKKLLEEKEYSRALMATERLDEDRRAAAMWSRLARYYYQAGQQDRAEQAAERSFAAAANTHYDDDKIEAFASVAENLARAGELKRAMEAMEKLPEGSKGRNQAFGKIIKATAEAKQVAKAEEMLTQFSTEDAAFRHLVYAAVAKAVAQEKRPAEALEILAEVQDAPFIPQRDNALYAIAKGFARTKDFTKALEVLEEIKDPRIKEEAGKFIRSKQSENRGDIADETENAANEHREMPIARKAMLLAKQGRIADAARLMKTIEDDFLRVEQFRKLAEYQARRTDYYGMLGGEKTSRFLKPEQTSSSTLSVQEEAKLEQDLSAKVKQGKKALDIRHAPVSTLGQKLPAFPDADKLHLSKVDIRNALPLPTADAIIKRIYFGNHYFVNSKFKVAIGQAEMNYREKILTPEVIYIERGVATIPQIYDALRASAADDFLLKQGQDYTLRRAIVVSHNAKLVIDGAEVKNLRQSRQSGAILVNSGELHIVDTNLIGWDEETQAPHFLTTKNGYDFRPFINSWSGSKTYMGGSNSIALGYKKSKSFGLTMTMGPKKMLDNTLITPPRPTGILADNSFNNSYYGYYAYEADDVVMVGNEYKNGVIYGIDPHDRSRRLTMAFNTAYDSQKKHGIIISREVDDSSYIGNLSFDNHGSGFMIDRMSNGTYIYGNTGFGNGQDGLTLFESSCNLMASNHFFDNHSMGVRVRNSHDTGLFYNRLNENKDGGVYVYSNILEGQEAQAHRDFVMDPYAAVAAASLVGNHLEANGAGILTDDSQALLLRGNRLVKQSPKNYQGAWFRQNPYLESQYDIAKKGVMLTDLCPQGKWQPQIKCRWRELGVFRADGQRDFGQRIQHSPCNQQQMKKEV